ncbi:MAG TPA: hypothetical protein VE196_00950, partial [Pseudonocardiaceae bacterium]|nr:hypothetical protein [Pseudonocardiaceae bacterium]
APLCPSRNTGSVLGNTRARAPDRCAARFVSAPPQMKVTELVTKRVVPRSACQRVTAQARYDPAPGAVTSPEVVYEIDSA